MGLRPIYCLWHGFLPFCTEKECEAKTDDRKYGTTESKEIVDHNQPCHICVNEFDWCTIWWKSTYEIYIKRKFLKFVRALISRWVNYITWHSTIYLAISHGPFALYNTTWSRTHLETLSCQFHCSRTGMKNCPQWICKQFEHFRDPLCH